MFCYVKKEKGGVVGALIGKRYMGDGVPYYNHYENHEK